MPRPDKGDVLKSTAKQIVKRVARIGCLGLFLNGLLIAVAAADAEALYERALGDYHQQAYADTVIHLKNLLQQDGAHLAGHVLLGKTYLELGDGAGAEKELSLARSFGADPALVRVPLARALMLQDRHQTLLERFVPAQSPAVTRFDLYLLRGQAQLELMRLPAAQTEFSAAQSLEPGRAEPLVGQATVALRQYRFGEADRLMKAAKELGPDNPEVWHLAGAIQHAQGALQPALLPYNRALELEPRHLAVRVARAGLYMDLQRNAEALRDIRYLRETYPLDPRPAYLQGVVLARQGDAQGAQAALREAADILERIPAELMGRHPPSLLLAGLVNYSLQKNEQAISFLSRYLQQMPGQVGARKLLGALLTERGDDEKALKILEPALALAANDPALLTMLGSVYARVGEHYKAAELLGRAVELQPDGIEARMQRATLNYVRGQRDQAMMELAEVFGAGQGEAQAGIMLSIIHLQRGEAEQGLAVARRLHASDPDNLTLRNLVAAALVENGQLDEARAQFQAILRTQPEFLPAQVNLGKLERASGRLAAARKRFTALAQAHPQQVEPLLELARVAQAEGDLETAIRWVNKAYDLAPDTITVVRYLSGLYLDTDAAQRAQELVRKHLRDAPEQLDLLERLGQTEIALRQRVAARSTFKNMSQLAGFDAARLVTVARYQIRLEDYGAAAWSLRKALEQAPDAFALQALMGEVELAQAKYAAAQQRAQRLQTQWPERTEGFLLLGDVHGRQGQHDKAAAAYAQALQRQPVEAIAVRLGLAHQQAGDGARAIRFLEDWTARHGQHRLARLSLAELYLASGDLDAAGQRYQDLLETGGDHPRVLNNLAYISLRQGKADALDYARRAHALDPDNPATNDTLGWVLVRTGQPEAGLPYLREAHTRAAGHAEIRYHLGAALAALGREREARVELRAALAGEAAFDGREAARALLRELDGPASP